MKTNMFFLALVVLLGTSSATFAQPCNCTISQVKNNTVQPCNTTIGTIVNVSTVAEFRQAIYQANTGGGNMTILMADGVYQISTTSYYPFITASNVVIRSQSGNRDAVILEGDGMRDAPVTINGLYFVGNNCTVADLTIRNMANHGVAVDGDFLTVHNVRFVDIYTHMLKGTNAGDGADNGLAQCSLFEYTAGIGPQEYMGGIDVHEGDDWIVRDNVFRNLASPAVSASDHAVLFWRSGSNITVERNEIFNCDRGIGFGLGDGVANGLVGGIIRNNIIYNDGNHPFSSMAIGLEHSPGTKVYNNTIHTQFSWAIDYRFSGTTNVEIANNITNQPIISRDGGTANVYSNNTQGQANWYVDAANGDLRIAGNPGAVIDQGVILSDVADDIDQSPRVGGTGYDLGASEVGNQPPPPSTPTCDCNVQQVKTNTVPSCNYTIGTIVNVSTVTQFKQAISQANSSGGNMTILIADGVYQIADVNSYPYVTASDLVIRSASGNRNACILEGDGMVDNNPTTVNGFLFKGNNVVVADLTIRNVGNHGIQTDGDFIYVHNVRFVDIYEQMFKGSSGGDGADNGQIQCSLFEYTAGIGPNWYIGGIDVHEGDNWIVRDNVFRDIASPFIAVAEHAVHFWRTGSNITVERNEIVNCDRGVGFGLGDDPANGIIGGIIRNNTIYNEGIDPYNDVGIGLEYSPNTKVYNNTVLVQNFRAIEYRWVGTTNADIANNLTNQIIGSRNGGTANVYSNYDQAQASWFVDASTGDLRLSGSPGAVVDQGTTLADVTDDLNQTPRPNGAAYDLGAHEVGNQPPPPPPVPTCNCKVEEVKNNTVQPCNTTIGNVVNVSTATEFKQAISQANSTGGNVTILMADGVYQVADPSSYPYVTASNIVIRGASGNRDAVIIEGNGMSQQPTTVNGIFFTGDNSIIADLTIRNVGNHAIQVSGDYLYVHNVRFVDIFEQMIKGPSSGDGADNGRIQCSLFEYTAGIGPQWYIGGIDIHKGDNWVVNDNVFRDIASPSFAIAEHAIHFRNYGSNNTIERNEIFNCDRGIGFGLGADPAGVTGGIIRNNTIFNEGIDPYHDVGIILEQSPDTKIYNNTVHVQYQNAIEYRFAATTKAIIANNLTNKPITSRNGGTANVYSNYTQAQAGWYVDPANGDLRLSGSPGAVVDQGVNLADVLVDLDQTPRPNGAGYDFGAYEVGNQPPPPSTPNCNCTVQEVKNNTVQPCNYTVGTIVNVSTVSQFKQAISQANSSGGNMTILIADGVYRVADVSSYPYVTASNLVIRSASGNRNACILEGDGMVDNNPATVNGFFFVGNNVVVADLTIRNVGNHGIQTIGDYIYVHNVRFVDIYEQMFKGASSGDGADNGQIQCSLFEYTAGIGPNWYIGGIDVHEGDNWIVRDNVFRDIASPFIATAEHAVHFWRTGSNITVERNEIVNCDRGVGYGLGNDPANGITGGIIRNNTIYNEGIDPYHDVGIGLEYSPNTKVYNNTIFVQYSRAIEYRWAGTTNADIANNLTNKPITSRDGGSANVYSNYLQAQANWFVDAANGDLRLSGSPSQAVDQGVTLSDVTVDLDQTPRPNGAAYDLGAHETGQSTTQTEVSLALWLEGALYTGSQYLNQMRDDFYSNGLLPGQTPVSPTAPPTPAGHPYAGPPWNYGGTEGGGWTDSDYQTIANQTGQPIVDWVLVSFRSGIPKSTELTKVAALLLKDGTVYFPFKNVFNQPFPGPVYVVVEHRNHMGIMTANAIPTINGILTVDFRQTNSYQAGGFGQKEISSGVWAMYGGDGDQATDGPGYEVTGKDRILWAQNNGLFSLYSNSDFTLDVDISGFDKTFWSTNNGVFSNIER